MASINIIGVIERISYIPNQNGCFVFISEYRKGYKRKDGVRVEDKVYQWKVIFKQGLTKYVSDHFVTGMTVEVKGDALPFAVEHEQTVNGYTVFGQTMNIFSFPRPSERLERKAIRESMQTSSGVPDIDGFMQPDF